MPEHPCVLFDHKTTRRLSDLSSLARDLTFATEAASRGLSLYDKDKPDTVLLEALWSASLIAYFRCFGSGARAIIPESLFDVEGPGDPLGLHRHYKDIRDKHLAHAVSVLDVSHTGLVLSEAPDVHPRVIAVANLQVRDFPQKRDFEILKGMATYAREFVERHYTKTSEEVKTVANVLSEEELMKLPPLQHTAMSRIDAARKRRKVAT